MTVFRGFIKLALRQLHMLLLYVAVFVTIAVIVQLSLREEETDTFEMTSLPVAVEDRDGGAAAEGLPSAAAAEEKRMRVLRYCMGVLSV